MNSLYCISLGSCMIAAICKYKDDNVAFLCYWLGAVILAVLGGTIK